jgi:hypothetical protein
MIEIAVYSLAVSGLAFLLLGVLAWATRDMD